MFAVFDTIRAKSPVNGTVADNKLLKLVNGGELLVGISHSRHKALAALIGYR